MALRNRLSCAPVVSILLCLYPPHNARAQAPETGVNTAGRYFVARLQRGAPQSARAALASGGYRELAILPGQRVLLEKVASAAQGLALYAELSIEPYTRDERISSELSQLPATHADTPVLIHAMPGTTGESTLNWLAAAGLPRLGIGTAGDTVRISTRLPGPRVSELVEQLGNLEGVFFVERVHHLSLFNDRSAGTVQSGVQGISAAATPIWSKGLRGEGQILGLIDTGADVDSCWYSAPGDKLPKTNTWSQANGYGTEVDDSHTKVIAYDFLYSCDQWSMQVDCDDPSQPQAWDSNGHGTHCSGNMAGHRPNGGNNGMAPAAKLVIQDGGYRTNDCADLPGIGCPVVDLYPVFEQAYTQGVRIHNNSYGDNENAPTPQPSNYTARSQDVDRFVWDHKDMLLVFAAGNSGSGDAEFSVCSPSTNKNGLSVGSTRTTPQSSSDDDISSFSSRGWTADGRIKPDLLAPGCNTSAGTDFTIESHNCTQNSGCGTSYAAPVLAGAAALVRQYFTDGYYPSGNHHEADALQPTAALVKAMLINGAVSMKGRDNAGQSISPIPSNEQGWGRIELDRALLFEGATRTLFVDDHHVGFKAGDTGSIEYTIAGVSAAEPFKVTLVWTDYPGTPDSAPRAPKLHDVTSLNAPQLINDLDLEVSDGTTTYLGNVFSDGASTSGGVPDQRNNVEQVLVAAPAEGSWSVRVRASHIVKAEQDYALVLTGKWTSARAAEDATGSQPSAAAGTGLPARQGSAGMQGGAGTRAGDTPMTSETAGSAPLDADTGSMPTAGSGASGIAASQTGTLAQFAQTSAGAPAAAAEPPAPSSTGCDVTGRSTHRPAWLLGAACLALLFARSRRRHAQTARARDE